MKQYYRFRMDFAGMWMKVSAVCMGMSIFLLAVYYFGITQFHQHTTLDIVLSLCIPLFLSVVYIFLLSVIRWDAPGAYGILGVLFCILFLLDIVFSGNLLRLILGAIWYVFCALVFLAVSGGYLPGKLPAAFVFAIAFFVRLFAFDLGVISGQAWILEGSTLCAIASLMFLPLAMVVPKPKEE